MPEPLRTVADVRQEARQIGIPLIGESPAFLSLLHSVERVAAHAAATVLISGETGTGKELVARSIHYLGRRRDFPFVPVNCGALPESLAENELFGHCAGAYTGASGEATGLVRLANNGTLFLDEVDALPPKAQVALLRFLQDGHFRPLGASREERVDVRIIAASNHCLKDEIAAGRFRQDLYYRLDLIGIEVPPLRARAGDALLLSRHFLKDCARVHQMPEKLLGHEAASWFDDYQWPGNVRELQNLIHRAWLFSDDHEVRLDVPASVPPPVLQPCRENGAVVGLAYREAKSRALRDFDRIYLTRLLNQADGNVTKAAQLAGKERRAFGKLLKHYSILVQRPNRARPG